MILRWLSPVALILTAACAADPAVTQGGAAIASPSGPPPATPPLHVGHGSPPAFDVAARKAAILAALPKLDDFFDDLAKDHDLPSLAVGLVVDGELVWSKGYGTRAVGVALRPDADTVYRIGSVTKTFTAAAALKLRDEGRLSLDRPAAELLPELAEVVYPTADAPPITLRHLLTHSSGLPRIGTFSYADPKHAPDAVEILGSLRGLELGYVPGTNSLYSNLGVMVAGLAVERAAHQRYRDYVTKELLAPLGMTSTVWDREAVPAGRLATGYDRENGLLEKREHWRLGAGEGAGGLYSTVRDLGRWASFHLAAYPARDDADAGQVRRATLREAMTPQRFLGFEVKAAKPDEAHATAIGFAWHTHDDCAMDHVVWHSGGTEGYSSMVAMAPERGVALVALSNMIDAHLDLPVFRALDLLAKQGAIPPRHLVPSRAILEVRDRLSRLIIDFKDDEAARLFAPAFLKTVPVPRIRAINAELVNEVGACTPPTDSPRMESVDHAFWTLTCERGWVNLDVALTKPDEPLIAVATAHPSKTAPEVSTSAGGGSKRRVTCAP